MSSAALAQAVTPSGGKLFVNGATGTDSGNTCRLSGHPCKTINYALSVASPGDTISVTAGTYAEQLDINKNITIQGAGKGKTIIQPTSLTTADTDPDHPSTSQAVIVYFGAAVTSGNLKSLTVDGSRAAGSFTAGSTDYLGVEYQDASGALSAISVINVQQVSGAFGDQPGPNGGIYAVSDSVTGTPSHVTMTSVTVNAYDKNGITCKDPGTLCTITSSTVTGIGPTPLNAQNGIEIYGADASVTHTTVTGNSYTSPGYSGPGTQTSASGILELNSANVTISNDTIKQNDENVYAVWDPAAFGHAAAGQGTWTITNNTANVATNNTGIGGDTKVPIGEGIGDGIDLDGAGATSGSTTNVSGNTVSNGADYGIALLDVTGATVSGNHTNGNADDGIYVGDNPNIAANTGQSTGNTVSSNTSNSNKVDGILADVNAQDTGNTFTSNALASNIHYDAEDLSTGTGTGDTANAWSNNVCKPASDGSPEATCTATSGGMS